MSDLITYDDKIRLKSQNVSDKYKVTAEDMNEIKEVVNNNAQEGVSVGTEAPTDGRRVWFEKGKNLFDGQLELGMYDETGAKATNNTNYRNVAPINVQPNTTYTFSINGTSQKYVIYLYKKDGTFIRVSTLTSGTFTTPAEAYLLNFRCSNADFTSDYANLKIQLEQGSTATSYEPYIEKSIKVDNEDFISTSNLVSVGIIQPSDGKRVWFKKSKNLFTSNALPDGTTIGITKTFDNSEIKLSGTSTSGAELLLQTSLGITLPAGTYTMSYIKKSGSVTLSPGKDIALYLRKLGSTTNLVTHTVREINGSTRSTTFTLNEATTLSYYIYCNNSGIVLNDFAIQVQIEEGSSATTYEPYGEKEIYVDEEEWYSKPKVLYENTTGIAGSSSGTQITLNNDVNNYSKLEVTLGVSKAECDTYILPIWATAKTVSVFLAGLTYYFRFRIEASDNILTFTEVSIVGWSDGTSKLFRVVGYK